MSTNPLAKTVLCYGDSNTFGQRSDDFTLGRWPADVRWTGQLQDLLGSEYVIIEEGLSGRTTDIQDGDTSAKNGKDYLVPCLESHGHIDVVVLMIGTNDYKDTFNRTAPEIAEAIIRLVSIIKTYHYTGTASPRVLVVSPIHIADSIASNKVAYNGFSNDSVAKSLALSGLLQDAAQKIGYEFLDASISAHAGEDNLHLSLDSHASFAAAVASKITAMQL